MSIHVGLACWARRGDVAERTAELCRENGRRQRPGGQGEPGGSDGVEQGEGSGRERSAPRLVCRDNR